MTEELPENYDEALAFIHKLQAENTEQKNEITELKATVDKQNLMLSNLNEMLVKGRKAMFGKSSERLSNIDGSEQLSLFNEAEQESSAKAEEPTVETVTVNSHQRKKRLSREELPDSVEHRKIVIDLDDKKCPECGEKLVCIGEEFVCSKLNIIPAQIEVLDYYQKKYKCKSCEEKDPDNISIIKPEMPVPVIKKSMASAGTIAYVIQHSAKVVEQVLGKYAGYLQTDGYAAYNAAVNATRLGCWSHARRKWVECLPKGIEDKNSKAAQALELVEQIFAEDKRLEAMPEDEVYAQRLERIKPLLERYWELLGNISAVGGSNLDKAVNYSLNNKKELEAFLLDGRLELTNNRAERAVKPFVMGRKNWLFSDTNKGADASMMWYSVIESAKLNNLNVYDYLLHLLTELPKLGDNPGPE